MGCSKPASMRSVVVLPHPDGPEQGEELARLDLEVDAVDGGDAVELLAEPDIEIAPPPCRRGAPWAMRRSVDSRTYVGKDGRLLE